jgi:RNA-splicing ligase RtcB
VPIGGVIAHETLVSPSGVGYDIGCGNKAVLTDALHRRFRASVVSLAERWREMSVILEGIENAQASLSLYSTIHGAGRVMGRMEAEGKRDRNSGEWKR